MQANETAEFGHIAEVGYCEFFRVTPGKMPQRRPQHTWRPPTPRATVRPRLTLAATLESSAGARTARKSNAARRRLARNGWHD